MKRIAIAALLISAATAALAADADKYLSPGTLPICPQGEGLTYTIVCDQGSRSTANVIFPGRAPGAAICRATFNGCSPISGRAPDERRGFEVRDAEYGNEMVVVTFGLENLLGEAYGARR